MSNVKQRGNPLFFKTKTKLLKKIQHNTAWKNKKLYNREKKKTC